MKHDEFQKFDGKKNRLELIEPEFIEELGSVLSFGAEKYEAWNWLEASSDEDQNRIMGAMMRHMMAYMKGEKLDPETGLPHLSHMSCNAMFLNHFDRNKGQVLPSYQPKEAGIYDAIMNLSFPDELKFEEHVFVKGLRGDDRYRGWIIYGFNPNRQAVILNTQANEVILAKDFKEFKEFFAQKTSPVAYSEDPLSKFPPHPRWKER